MNITFVTCWYKLKSKFDENIYKNWMSNFLNNVNNFNLVIYTNKESYGLIESIVDNTNNKIKIVIKEYEHFKTWEKKELWMITHSLNDSFNNKSIWNIDWKLNMLWSEKINFVNEVIKNKYFETEWYGWCDIGYFRGGNNLSQEQISQWPNPRKINELNKSKIYYGLPGSKTDINNYIRMLLNKNNMGFPINMLPLMQISVAGGFFLINREKIQWWYNKYYTRLYEYLDNKIVVKDDQYVIIDCIANNLKEFKLIEEKDPNKDKWFVFQSFLV